MGNCLFLRKGETHTVPISGILASDLAVGSSVYLMEKGVSAEYLVVHQGLPGSMYDESCNGTWLLRKDIYGNRAWNSSNVNDYANSTIHSYLNSTFLALFDANIQSAIKQVKLPYRAGGGYGTTVTSGSSGLSAKIFLLSSAETSFSHSYMPSGEGAELSYFSGCADSASDSKRIAYLNGSVSIWWPRSPYCFPSGGSTVALYVDTNGDFGASNCSSSYGIRPALVLPSTAIFDKNTIVLKGVA